MPRDAGVGGERPRPDLVGLDEPFVDDAEDQLLSAAPARGVAVAMRRLAQEQPGGAQMRRDRGRRLGDAGAFEGAEAAAVATLLVRRVDHGEAIRAPELEVLLAAAGRDVDDAGALVRRHVAPLDDAVLDALLRRQVGE